MKIVLYEEDTSILSKVASFVTQSKYTRAAVLLDRGVCYFTSSDTMLVPLVNIPEDYRNRNFRVFNILTSDNDDSVFKKAMELKHRDPNVLNIHDFEYVLELLGCYYPTSGLKGANDLLDVCESIGIEARFINCRKTI